MADTESSATETEATTTETAAGETETVQQKPTDTVDFWKAKAREQEKRAKENAEAATRLAAIEESQKSEQQKLADARDKAIADMAKANARVVRAEVKALAAELFADPGDAPLYLDLAKYEVDADGDVDAGAIKADLAAVLAAKPHLAKGAKKPLPDPSQGSNGQGKKESTPGLGRLRDAYAASAVTK